MALRSGVSAHRLTPLEEGWQLAGVEPGRARGPEDLATLALEWRPARVPGTVASALGADGSGAPPDIEARDWWYRCRFAFPRAPEAPLVLRFGGLATLADAWLNGEHLLHSENMFLARQSDVSGRTSSQNELVLRFSSLEEALRARRPRPRWRTRLVRNQQLRFFRTSFLGRMPGWSEGPPAVGPWRPVTLEERGLVEVERLDHRVSVDAGDGVVRIRLRVRPQRDLALAEAELVVGEVRARLSVHPPEGAGVVNVEGEARLPAVALWWPHTHGDQPLYPVHIRLRLGEVAVTIDCGRCGFRTLEREEGSGFGLRVNGVPVFCRGACWTPADPEGLNADPAAYRGMLEAARAAGMNMLRVGGTMVYETDAFYDLCDELGLLLWQDFMFANLDYPAGEPAFAASVREEAAQLLQRLQARPCLAVLCGGSEVTQQAAMLGLPREAWSGPLFEELLPSLCAQACPEVPYWPSTPTIGEAPSAAALPFVPRAAVTHYYGVGAYMRGFEDPRRAEVGFAAECLGFSNVPEAESIERSFEPHEAASHHPRWKQGVPRDIGASWDFEDVRDHYLERLFGIDAPSLRRTDAERYLALSRVATGEVMARVFAEWRRCGSCCRGALVWFLRDLRPGAGWGVLDAWGAPKAAYYYLRRALAPVALLATDEGLNGLDLHAVNDTAVARQAELVVGLYREGERLIEQARSDLDLPARGAVLVPAQALFPGFRDLTYAYRFGPPGHDLVRAALSDRADGSLLGEAWYFPMGPPSAQEADVGLAVEAAPSAGGSYLLRVRTRRFAQSVAVLARGFLPEDNYFHLAPGGERNVVLRRAQGAPIGQTPAGEPLQATVSALNARAAARIETSPR